MESKLEIKQIPFLGSELIAARDRGGRIWAGIRWMCDGLRLSEGQRKRQIANIQADRVLSKGGSNLLPSAMKSVSAKTRKTDRNRLYKKGWFYEQRKNSSRRI